MACLFLSGCSDAPERKIYVEKKAPPALSQPSYKPRLTQPSDRGPVTLRRPNTEREHRCKFYESGMASWYGYELYGNYTANGEKFEPDGITAAHKTLPFGTIVKVMMDNGKGNPEGVYVRINDRGPFVHGRIIDLSLGAAKKLGMKDTQPVHIYTCS